MLFFLVSQHFLFIVGVIQTALAYTFPEENSSMFRVIFSLFSRGTDTTATKGMHKHHRIRMISDFLQVGFSNRKVASHRCT